MRLIGIDLGTTNSLVSVFEHGRPRILRNDLDEALTPSVVAVAEDGALLVGRPAKDRLVRDPAAGRAFFKRDMGTEAVYDFGGRRWTPTECSALVLREMKRVAEARLGEPVDRAVITVPAYFRDSQRTATTEAAAIAGLGVARILNEPTAAALAFGHRNPEEESQVLVFDLGGGTFDVTILEVFDGVIQVAASAGESRLGGEDYTDALITLIADRCGTNLAKAERAALRPRVEVLKRRLGKQEKAALVVGPHELVVTRRDLETAGRALTARLRPVVTRCLRDAGLEAKALNDVLLVGGASRMPLVHDFIRETLGRDGSDGIDPDRVVALGAAIQAGLCAEDEAVEDLVLTDVAPHTLGIEIAKQFSAAHHQSGFFEPLIDRNTTVPISRVKRFNTLHPEQDLIEVKVYQGEGRKVKDNHLLGSLQVKGLAHRRGQRNAGEIDIRFTYDMNGILEVEVTVLHDGTTHQLVIEERPGAMTKKQIEAAIQRLRPLKLHPRDHLENRARLERGQRLFEELRGPAREELVYHLDRFEAALESQEPAAIAEAGEHLDALLEHFFREEGESQGWLDSLEDQP